jgi:alkylation response protein AidB-like acyl-CoA dehydrogenase
VSLVSSSDQVGSEVDADEHAVLERAREISRDVLLANAPQYDETAQFPRANFDVMHEAGFIGCVVPKEYGGLGLRPPAYAEFLKILAKGCAATAGSFHMHNSVMVFLDMLATEEQKAHYYAEAVTHGHLFGSWGAEPGTSWAGKIALNTNFKQTDDGYTINGAKYFCSLGDGATYGLLYAVPAERAQEANIEDVLFFILAVDQPGVEIRDEWDPLGMRATVSKPVIMSDCVVPELGRVGQPGDVLRLPTEFYALGYSAFYQGIAEAAYDWALHHAKTRTVMPSNQPIGKFERIQRKIGSMSLRVHAGALAVQDAARRITSSDRSVAVATAMKAKAITTEVVLDVTGTAIEVAGGPGVIRGMLPERLMRDGRTAVLMVPAYDQCVETIARNELGYGVKEVQ